MIRPVDADRLDCYYEGFCGLMVGQGFNLYVDDECYQVIYTQVDMEWEYRVTVGRLRRSTTDILPTDSTAQSVVGLLNEQDTLAAMTILEYLTASGFDVTNDTIWGKLKRLCKRLFRRELQRC